MEIASGRVRRIEYQDRERHALVDVEGAPFCARCAQGRGCGAAVWGSSGRARRIDALVAADLDLGEGDLVEIGFESRDLLAAALAVYGAPLAGLAGAAAAVSLVRGSDLATAGGALAGLVLGIAAGRYLLRRWRCPGRLQPRIERRLDRARPGPAV